jgi:hypothetical protein
MILHLLRCQGFGVAYYSLTLGRLGSTAPSAFATLGSRKQEKGMEEGRFYADVDKFPIDDAVPILLDRRDFSTAIPPVRDEGSTGHQIAAPCIFLYDAS